MTKRSDKLEEEKENIQGMPEQLETILILSFEDVTISKQSNGLITIDKIRSGISDSTFARVAVGPQKTWQLFNENGVEVETGSQKGNRPFHYSGMLSPGLYVLTTGPGVKDYSKHRIPGRGYKIVFRIV